MYGPLKLVYGPDCLFHRFTLFAQPHTWFYPFRGIRGIFLVIGM